MIKSGHRRHSAICLNKNLQNVLERLLRPHVWRHEKARSVVTDEIPKCFAGLLRLAFAFLRERHAIVRYACVDVLVYVAERLAVTDENLHEVD